MKKQTLTLVMVLIALMPLAYLVIVWPTVPNVVALHFNSKMEPDRLGDKSSIWLAPCILAGVSILTFFLLTNLKSLDPKRRNAPPSNTFNKLAAGILVFLTALNFIIIISMIKGAVVIENFMFPILGLFFAFLGNVMNNLKPNYFAGFRLPWTLSDDDNWRKTHHLAGKIFFAGGIILTIASLFLPKQLLVPFFLGILFIMVIIPVVYSYRLFKNKPEYQSGS